MAVLTTAEKVRARRMLVEQFSESGFTKTEIDAVIQAIEDTMKGAPVQSAISSAIDGARPGLSVGQKNKAFAIWALVFAESQGAI